MNKVEWLLSKVAEEANEVAQVALKAQKYGLEGVKPGSDKSNLDFLQEEYLDLITAIHMLENHLGMVIDNHTWKQRLDKRQRVINMMEISRKIGKLDE